MNEDQKYQFCVNCVNCNYKETDEGEELSKCLAPENMERDLVTGRLKQKENSKYCVNVRKYAMLGSPQCRWFISKEKD